MLSEKKILTLSGFLGKLKNPIFKFSVRKYVPKFVNRFVKNLSFVSDGQTDIYFSHLFLMRFKWATICAYFVKAFRNSVENHFDPKTVDIIWHCSHVTDVWIY